MVGYFEGSELQVPEGEDSELIVKSRFAKIRAVI
jgi:hypothetical protein